MFQKAYSYRFQIFLFTLIGILFGGLLFPNNLFDNLISPIIFLSNLTAGILLISKRKKIMFFLIFLLLIAGLDFGSNLVDFGNNEFLKYVRLGVYFLFYIVVTIEIIIQIWNSKTVNEQVIFGVICGYISLGLIAFFICFSIELSHPESFKGLLDPNGNMDLMSDSIMYYSYITLMTIGYGDVVPITQIAQMASILIGLMGQFYLVIITAIIVGKYINQTSRN